MVATFILVMSMYFKNFPIAWKVLKQQINKDKKKEGDSEKPLDFSVYYDGKHGKC